MKWTKWFLLFTFIVTPFINEAQDSKSEILITVGDEKVTRDEFERIYMKNNQMVNESDKKSLDEYLQLFISYKLKVAEAKANGLDKSESFVQELDGYRQQLVQPYLTDEETEKKLYEEAYQRMRYEVNASHILISVPEKATPEDTLAIYNKVLKIRERIFNGEPFDVVARATSDDPSVKKNNGQLGYFTVFQMVYPFENAAYRTSIGDVSMPVRTRFGYHLVKVHDKRSARWQIKVAHIMVAIPQNATPEQEKVAQEKFDGIYKQVLSNEDFGNLARQFSEDPGSAKNGGELPWFGSGRMVPEFEQAAFALEENNQISKPLRTAFGWHVIKRIDKKDIGTFDEMLPEIKNKISRDSRMQLSRDMLVEKLQSKHGFSMDSNSLKIMVNLLDSSIYKTTWKAPIKPINQTLFTFAGKQHSIQELATKIESFQKKPTSLSYPFIVYRNYDELVEETIFNFEENRLLTENLDFFYLMKEYHDGILLFEITDKNVWSKASSDTAGLKEFYNQNIANYSWDKRAHSLIYKSSNEAVIKKAHKLAASKKGAALSNAEFISKIAGKSEPQLEITKFDCEPSHVTIKGWEGWISGISPITSADNNFSFVRFMGVNEKEPKPLSEIRGQVIADYQDHLEKIWLETLKAKYPVVVNQEVFDKMAASLN